MAITREMLDECFDTMKLSESIWERMQRLRARMERTTPTYAALPGGSGASDRIGDGVAELDELLSEFNEEVNAYAILAADVNEAVHLLEKPKHRNIMGLRYLDGLKWEDVAKKAGYSVQRCYELHDEALKEMGLPIPEKSRANQS